MSREVICPAVYKHFKNLNYATMLCSVPATFEEITDYALSRDMSSIELLYVRAIYTEDLKTKITIFKLGDKYCHLDDLSNEELVVYRPLYPFKFNTVARPKEMFLSKVDKEKYPYVEQEYRFELVRH